MNKSEIFNLNDKILNYSNRGLPILKIKEIMKSYVSKQGIKEDIFFEVHTNKSDCFK